MPTLRKRSKNLGVLGKAVCFALLVITFAATPPALAQAPVRTTPVRVVSVTDGDTIRVFMAGREEAVRLIGIDTPEVFGRVELFGREASAFTKRHLELDFGHYEGVVKAR